MTSAIDHLVIVAADLAQGAAWCEATLGITPGPGGEHTLFGTHNRLFKIATPTHPMAYCEIIAINPNAARAVALPSKRWFDMDNPALQAAVAIRPRLVHFVASTNDVQTASAALQACGIDRGPARPASRLTARGLLQWQITVREDGQRLFDGMLPTLIQWGPPDAAGPAPMHSRDSLHPRNSLPRSGVTLRSVTSTHPEAAVLQAAYSAIGLEGVAVQAGPANLAVTLNTPKGIVTLESSGL